EGRGRGQEEGSRRRQEGRAGREEGRGRRQEGRGRQEEGRSRCQEGGGGQEEGRGRRQEARRRNAMMRNVLIVASLTVLAGCSFSARGQDDYRKAVRTVLGSRSSQVEQCYRAELASNKDAHGKVVVKFDVEPKTGSFAAAKIVEGETTANKAVQKCVLD